jgi:hypothetical protein
MLDADLSTYKIQIKMITDVAVAAEDCRITGEKASEAESDKVGLTYECSYMATNMERHWFLDVCGPGTRGVQSDRPI